jgi:acetyl-CoA synthetase
MTGQVIPKSPLDWRVRPNLINYEETYQTFAWQEVKGAIAGLPGGKGLNIAYEAVDRHAEGARRNQVALRWLGRDGAIREFTYAGLRAASNRFANVLKDLGVGKGDRVFVLTGRIPELYLAALGAWKNTSVFCPLCSAFGPEPILRRLSRGDAKVLVTTTRLYEQKVAAQRHCLPHLEAVLLVDHLQDEAAEQLLSLPKRMAQASAEFTIPPTDSEDMAMLHFTCGTTGMPKGAIHVHNAVYTQYVTGKSVLDFHPGDVFWCTADPGSMTGTAYGLIAPLLHGVTNIVDEAEFDAERWYRILQDEQVTVWYTAPTAIRRLMHINNEPRKEYDLSHLRLIHSAGEPLNPEAVVWGKEKLGLPIHDNWWQTETGGIMIANYPALAIRPGSIGCPLPGIEATIVRRVGKEHVAEVCEPNVEGELVLKPGWPSMFRGYLHDEQRYQQSFIDGWYLTGDLARRDADGYFWFSGRADDLIKTAGQMVSSLEVERALMAHPAVAEAGVIGKPEPTIGELVKAFVALKPGFAPDDKLRLELLAFGRQRLGAALAPKEIEFIDVLPRTRSGKVMRRLLKARELGLSNHDRPTLEEDRPALNRAGSSLAS